MFKDGKNVAELETSETNVSDIHRSMVGRELQGAYYRQGKQITPSEDVVLKVEHLSKKGGCQDVSF